MDRIGVFGGSFDPPHIGHLLIAGEAMSQFQLDHLLWIPACVPPHKTDQNLASDTDRMEMIRRTIAGHRGFILSDLEIERSGVSYTVDTLESLQQNSEDRHYFLLIGEDSLLKMDSWRAPERIRDLAELIVYPRRRSDMRRSIDDPRVHFLDAPLLAVSSSAIRRRIQSGQCIDGLVTADVASWILDHHLYLPG